MENQRLFLYLTLGVVLLLVWTTWQEDYGRPTRTAQEQEQEQEQEQSAPAARAPAAEDAPDSAPGGTPASAEKATQESGSQTVHVVTDLLDVEISTIGGGIRSAKLRQYDVSVDDPTAFSLLQPSGPLFVAESGLVADSGEAPGGDTRWRAEKTEYRLAEGEDRLVVPLTWTGADGVTVTKRYVFSRNRYLINLEHAVDNASGRPWRAYQYVQLRRAESGSGQMFLGARSYTGGVIYSPAEKYEKISFDDMRGADLSRDVVNGWVAMIQHYFLAAWVPPRDVTERFYTQTSDNDIFILGMSSPWETIAPGSSGTFGDSLFVGPKEQDRLDVIAEGLELAVDYGWFTILSKPLFIALDWIHGVVGNWGWAIILLTVAIKAVFFKLSETSYRSMARMRKLQPRMQQLKERFGDDRQRMNQELMELYKKEKVNPLGGCLPILIQIPVFIALYWVLLESVELRQAPWILWIEDLSIRDPYYVLPLIMGATMLLQQRLNPAPMDPIQQKVMTFLPIVFTVFFLFFPAGLVLYWVTNNSLSILQQWVITRRVEAAAPAH